MELKLLAMIMGEAVRLGHADANPLVSLKLRRDSPHIQRHLQQSAAKGLQFGHGF